MNKSNSLKENPRLVAKALDTVVLGQKWLDLHEEEIKSFQDLNAHYKACYLHAVTGNAVKSRYYADLMHNRYLRDDGDFRTEENNKGWDSLPCSPANRYIYPNGWIVSGLQKTGAYYTARRGLEFLIKMRDSKTGGFYSRFDFNTKQPNTTYVDTSSTSSAGLAMLACGQKDYAVSAGEFVLMVLSSQPEPDQYYFSSWITDKGLHTDVFGDEDQNSIHGRKQYCLNLKGDPRSELIWLLGKPMKFLSRLYELTHEKRYLEGALALFSYFELQDECKYDQLAACKIMWGGAELYRHTGQENIKQAVCRIMEAICDSQDPSGTWLHRLWYDDLKDQSFAMSLDCVQEMCLEITDIIYDLA